MLKQCLVLNFTKIVITKKLLHQWLAFSGLHSKASLLFYAFQHVSPNSGLFRA